MGLWVYGFLGLWVYRFAWVDLVGDLGLSGFDELVKKGLGGSAVHQTDGSFGVGDWRQNRANENWW